MGGGSLPRKAVKAFRSAGATEEMIASARLIFASLPREAPGRPRMYKNCKEADHAYYERHRDRIIKLEANRRKNRKKPLSLEEVRAIHPATGIVVPRVTTKDWLLDAAGSNADRAADIGPIEALLAQGCDLEADVLPTVAQMVPELPRPLKNWGAKWLVQAILEARDQRIHQEDVAALEREEAKAIHARIEPRVYQICRMHSQTVQLHPKPNQLRHRRPPDACRPWTGTNLSRGTARAS
jgi:hypothetical protein